MNLDDIVRSIGAAVDLVGVVVIVLGAIASTVVYGRRLREGFEEAYRQYRVSLGRAILLGLEFLVAGDIIRTVGVAPTFSGVGILAIIVLIRTFLSWSLEVEIEGRFPWQSRSGGSGR